MTEEALEAFERIAKRFNRIEDFLPNSDYQIIRAALTMQPVDLEDVKQEFEKFPELTKDILYLHRNGGGFSLEWRGKFLANINAALQTSGRITTKSEMIEGLREKLIGRIKQKKGFYSISVGNSEVRQAHKTGILKGLDAAEKEIEAVFDFVKKSPTDI